MPLFLSAQTHSKNHFHASQLYEALVLFNYCFFLFFFFFGILLLCPDPTLRNILSGHLLSKFTLSILYKLAGHDKGKPLNSFAT